VQLKIQILFSQIVGFIYPIPDYQIYHRLMEPRGAGFQAFRQDTTPMIILEGVEPPTNNERLRMIFQQFNPTRCRMVFRNGKCLKIAGIEFSHHEDARRALEFSRRMTIDGFQVRSRPGTDKDREWWSKKRPTFDSDSPMVCIHL
jgi:RNA recognition motif-containing protein